MKRIIVSVTNDLVTDQRVNKVCNTLVQEGFSVLLVGRERKASPPMEKRDYAYHRMKLLFETGPLFYAEFNIRLFLFLLFNKADVLHSNDLDTLLPNYLISKLKGQNLVYDSHEYFTGVPEIQDRPTVKKVWKSIESFCLPKLKNTFTVNSSIADLYHKDYGIEMRIMRNIPLGKELRTIKTKTDLGLPADKKIIILQGAGINVDRGAEEAVRAMAHLEGYVLLIVGNGDVIEQLKEMAQRPDLKGRVIFKGRQPYEEMMQYTLNADLGLSLDKDNNINYRFSLPNKLFDYIHAGIPVLASRLPELAKIIEHYQVGDFIPNHQPEAIAKKIEEMLSSSEQVETWKANTKKAAKELTWEHEAHQLKEVYAQFS